MVIETKTPVTIEIWPIKEPKPEKPEPLVLQKLRELQTWLSGPRHWMKHDMGDTRPEGTGATCLLGAIYKVGANADRLRVDLVKEINQALPEDWSGDIIGFNDNKTTTKRKVLKIVAEAISSREGMFKKTGH